MKLQSFLFIFGSLIFSNLVYGHPGHTHSGFFEGFLHPIAGVDHLLVAISVGLWAVILAKRALSALPLSFVGSVLLGAWYGTQGHSFGFIELGIASSIYVLAFALFLQLRVPLWASIGLVSVFGFMHGLAHGSEIPTGLGTEQFFLGFTLATTLLHLSGILLASTIVSVLNPKQIRSTFRFLGAGMVLTGLLVC